MTKIPEEVWNSITQKYCQITNGALEHGIQKSFRQAIEAHLTSGHQCYEGFNCIQWKIPEKEKTFEEKVEDILRSHIIARDFYTIETRVVEAAKEIAELRDEDVTGLENMRYDGD